MSKSKKKRRKSRASAAFEWLIFRAARYYRRLTVRQLYYVMVSRFSCPPTKNFYNRMDYHLTKLRRLNNRLDAKFRDPTRHFIAAPFAYRKLELWVEKGSIRNFIDDLAEKYRLSIQVLRGFASKSMYSKAIKRAAKRGVEKILYIGDFDPSGLLIDRIAEREMKIKVKRIALTMEQIKRLKPPSNPVNMKDSRAKDYKAKYGDRCWEIESVRPRTLHRLIEQQLKMNLPRQYLAEAMTREKARKTTRKITNKLKQAIEKEALQMLKNKTPQETIIKQLTKKYKPKQKET